MERLKDGGREVSRWRKLVGWRKVVRRELGGGRQTPKIMISIKRNRNLRVR